LEGSDQYRGWFNSSLITSVAVSGHAPYKQVLSQGFTLDDKGRKMSKSLGNTIAPADVIKQMGAEIVRMWVASVDTSSDVRVSMESFKQVADAYKKFRNTVRFMLGNTTDFDPKKDRVAFEDLASVDQYMAVRLNDFVAEIKDHYDHYDFLDIYKKLINFLTVDLSNFYLDIAKDIMYIDAEDSHSRRSMQTVFYDVLVALTKLFTPMLPHTTEEIWPFLKEPEEFAQLTDMPTVQNYANSAELTAQWSRFMDLRSDVLKALEEARDAKLIGKSLEAHLDLYVDADTQDFLDGLNTNVRQMLMVSALDMHALSDAPADAEAFGDTVAIKVSHADGEVCARCRMVKTDVGSDDAYPTLCARCAAIVRENYPESVATGLEA
jgi:isoleucyl-tRNA synthetase